MVAARRDILLDVITDSDSRGLLRAARDLEQLSRGVDRAGDRFDATGDDAQRLRLEIDRTNDRVRDLHTQIARTGDLRLFGDINREERNLRNFRRTLDALMPDIGKSFVHSFVESIGSVPSRLRGTLIVSVIGLGASMAPILGSMVAGAVTGAVGLGGIAGGIAAAAKDTNVRRAAGIFAAEISHEFFAGGRAFVEPTVESLRILSQGFRDLDLGDSFARVAPHVTEVARGIADMGREFMPGFNRALDAAGPVLKLFAQELPEVGQAFGDMFADMAESEGTLAGMAAFMDALSGSARVLGSFITSLSNTWADFVRVGVHTTGVAERMFGWLPLVGDHIQNTAGHFRDWNQVVGNTAVVVGHLDKITGKWVVDGQDLIDLQEGIASTGRDARMEQQLLSDSLSHTYSTWIASQANAEESLQRLREAFEENGRSLDIHTEKGRDNIEMLDRFVSDAARSAQARFKETGSVADAIAVYDRYKAQLAKTLERAGYTREEARKLAEQWLKVPSNISTLVTTQFRTIGSPPRFSTGGQVDVRIFGGGFLERQHGGPVMPGQPYVVGEKGPELFVPKQAGTIVPNQTVGTAVQTGNARPVQISGGGLGQLVFTWLREEIAARGGTLAVLGIRE